jgi:hypothetical protein
MRVCQGIPKIKAISRKGAKAQRRKKELEKRR